MIYIILCSILFLTLIILTSAQQQNKPGRMTELGGRQLALKQFQPGIHTSEAVIPVRDSRSLQWTMWCVDPWFQQRKLIKEPSLLSQTGSLVGYTDKGSMDGTGRSPKWIDDPLFRKWITFICCIKNFNEINWFA